MTETETLSDDGLIAIPKIVQDHLGIVPGSRVQFRVAADGLVIFEKVGAETSLAGPDRFERLRGIAGPGPSTDEIMAELRGD